jgi:hypothetical protein
MQAKTADVFQRLLALAVRFVDCAPNALELGAVADHATPALSSCLVCITAHLAAVPIRRSLELRGPRSSGRTARRG